MAKVWLKENMSLPLGKTYYHRWPWIQIFSILCWLLWKSRCKGVMEGVRVQAKDVIHGGMYQLMESNLSDSMKHQLFCFTEAEDRNWRLPPEGYVRLDVDGSVNSHGSAACGGLVRDDRGKWVVGFQRKLGFAQSTTAELLALLTGLRLCKQWDFLKVTVYTDSLETYHLVMRDGGGNHPLRTEIHEIRDLLYSEWDVELRYAPRTTIRCADYLARDAHCLFQNMVVLPVPPSGCTSLLRADLDSSFDVGHVM